MIHFRSTNNIKRNSYIYWILGTIPLSGPWILWVKLYPQIFRILAHCPLFHINMIKIRTLFAKNQRFAPTDWNPSNCTHSIESWMYVWHLDTCTSQWIIWSVFVWKLKIWKSSYFYPFVNNIAFYTLYFHNSI